TKRNLPGILSGVQVDRAESSPWRRDGRVTVRIEKSFVTHKPVSSGIVSRKPTSPGEIIRIDVQEAGLRIRTRTHPIPRRHRSRGIPRFPYRPTTERIVPRSGTS